MIKHIDNVHLKQEVDEAKARFNAKRSEVKDKMKAEAGCAFEETDMDMETDDVDLEDEDNDGPPGQETSEDLFASQLSPSQPQSQEFAAALTVIYGNLYIKGLRGRVETTQICEA